MTLRRAWLGLAMGGLLATLVALPAAAQLALLEVKGEVQQPLKLSRPDLLALTRRDYTEQRTVTQDGRQAQLAVRYQGVPLRELLDHAGLKPGRRDIRRAIVLLTAKDG